MAIVDVFATIKIRSQASYIRITKVVNRSYMYSTYSIICLIKISTVQVYSLE